MNQRIRELGDQAWDYALDHETVNGKAAFGSFINKNFSDLLLEKFAQLIVAECVNHIKTVENTPAGFIQPKHSSVLEFELNQHFGTAT